MGWERKTKQLSVQLTDPEILAAAQELAAVMEEVDVLETREAERRQTFKASLAALDGRRRELGRKIARREEVRDVEVEVRVDWRKGLATETRVDTGEVIAERPVTAEERQARLPAAAAGGDGREARP